MRATPRVELGIAANSRVVLYAGTFAGYQGLEGLIAAIPSVKSRVPYAVFVFVGGTSHDELPADVTRLQREGTLRVVPRASRDELPRYYAAADVLVSPRSYGNNAPLKIFDYLNAGRPIVATDIAAHRALLAEERGLLVEPRPGAIADAIVRVLQDPQLAETLVRNANKYVSEHLGWDGFVKVVAEWYEQIAPRAAES
jgi:glycosyltransferase involved in cell wall biosynthesis